MLNNTFRSINSRNPTSANRRQHTKTGPAYCGVSNDGKKKLFVQRSDLVNSSNGLKAKAFVAVEQGWKNTEGRRASYKNGLRQNNINEVDSYPERVGSKNTRANGTYASKLAHDNATNNSSNKRSYFEPYDARRSPRKIQTCWNNYNFPTRTDPGMGQYVQPQYMGYHQPDYLYRQATNAATAVAPNGQTIYIPLDDQQYEIKKTDHDFQDMPVGSELFALESEFESNVDSISSPRPVDLKGGLSQDDSGDSSDEVSYGEPSTDSEDESVTTDDPEYVDNCVSNVLKTIAESVQNMSVEESKHIAQRAVEDFEEMQESKLLDSHKGQKKSGSTNLERNVSRQSENDSDQFSGSYTFDLKASDHCFDSVGPLMVQTNQQPKQNHAQKTTTKSLTDPSGLKYPGQKPKTARQKNTQNQIQDPSIVAMSTCRSGMDKSASLQAEHAVNLWNQSVHFNYEHLQYYQSVEDQWPPLSNGGTSLEVNDTSYSNALHNSEVNKRSSTQKSNVIEGLKREVNSSLKTSDNCFPVTDQNNWLVPEEDVTKVKPEIVDPLNPNNDTCCAMLTQNHWLTSEQNIDSVEQMLSPIDYGSFPDAVYMPGQVIIDGQGYFESSNFQTVQNQTLYTPDNYTFEAYQPEAIPSTAPAYTFFIHDACPPPPPEVVCHPVQESVPGELVTVTDPEKIEPKTNETSADANHDEFDAPSCNNQLSHYLDDDQHIVSHLDHQYTTTPPSSTQGKTSVENATGPYQTWDADSIDVQQNGGYVNESFSQNGQFFVSYDEENIYTDPDSGLSYPAIHMTEDCLITVIFREGVCLEMSPDQSLRLVNHEKKIVAAMSGKGKSACVIHPAARIYQSDTSVHAALYSNRRANMTDELVTFGNDLHSYKFDHKAIVPVDGEPNYMDLSGDESVKFLNTDDGIQPDSQVLRQRTLEILAHAHFWKHGKSGSTVIINGTKVVQSDKGDVSVYCGPIKFIRMNPARSIIRLKTQLFEVDIETNWNVKLSRGHLALNVSHLGFIVSNGKIKGCIDKDDKLQSFSLPDHRVLMLGQTLPQHRPGVPAWNRRRNINRNAEAEGDHSAYTRPIIDDDDNNDSNKSQSRV